MRREEDSVSLPTRVAGHHDLQLVLAPPGQHVADVHEVPEDGVQVGLKRLSFFPYFESLAQQLALGAGSATV
jgi:hypothetical protein